jgi:hypothetical protein
LRKAFVTNELPEINSSNLNLATSIYELALVLFPQYKDDLQKFILDIRQERISSLEKELKNIQIKRSQDEKYENMTLKIEKERLEEEISQLKLKPKRGEMITNEKGYKNNLKHIMIRLASKSPRLRPQEAAINDVFKAYDDYEAIMLELMGGEGNKDEAESLDRHKIAAALCCAVLKVRPIKFPVYLSSEEKLANEKCAFLLGMQVIQDCWSAKQKEKNISAEEKKIYSQPIRLPEPTIPNAWYSDMFAKLFKEEKTFDHFNIDQHRKFEKRLIFMISNIYFMIERYSFEFIKNELISETQAANAEST